jgi:hypothetical protein
MEYKPQKRRSTGFFGKVHESANLTLDNELDETQV